MHTKPSIRYLTNIFGKKYKLKNKNYLIIIKNLIFKYLLPTTLIILIILDKLKIKEKNLFLMTLNSKLLI